MTVENAFPWRMPSVFAFLPKLLMLYFMGCIYLFHGHVPSVAHDHFVINYCPKVFFLLYLARTSKATA